VTVDNGDEVTYLAAPGSEWRPDQADWSGQDLSVTTSSTFGIVKAANNEPRFDHDPVTLACKGLLIEEGRTNLVSRSQEFSNWSFTNSTLGSSATAPDGNSTANSVAFQNSTSPPATVYSSMARLVSVSVTAGQQYTVSFYVKASTNTSINIGTNGQTSPGNNSGALVNVTTSWTRVSFTLTAGGNDSGLYAVIGSGFNGVPTYLSARTIEIWGAQLEAGSFPTSYIPTTTGTLARSADVCSITTAGWSNAGNDTMVAEYFVERTTNAILVEGGPSISWMTIGFATTNRQRNLYRHGGSSTRVDAQTADNSVSFVSINKTALTSGEQIALNGSLSQTLLGDPPQSDISTILSIGRRSDGGFAYLNGHLASIRYYRKRLPDAKIQTITQLVSDVDANAYIVSLLSAGATVTPTQQAAINTFFKAEKMAGRYALLKRIYLPIWGASAANAICMKSLTSGTFVGNVTHGAGFVKSDGTTGYFDGGVSPAAAGCLLESASIFCLSYELNKFITNTERFCGVQGANNLTRTWIERYGSGNGPNTGTIVSSPVDNDHRYVFIRSRPNDTFRFNGRFRSVYETTASVSDAALGLESVQNVHYLGLNNNGTPNFSNVDAKLGSYGIGLGYTEIEAAGFAANLKTLWETCTGLTLP
jgi:hypothetical protein